MNSCRRHTTGASTAGSPPRKRTLPLFNSRENSLLADSNINNNDEASHDQHPTKPWRLLILFPLILVRGSRKYPGRALCCLCILLYGPTASRCRREHERYKKHWEHKAMVDQIAANRVISPLVSIPRECPRPQYATLLDEARDDARGTTNTTAAATPSSSYSVGRICMTTLTDERRRSILQRLYGWRNYRGVLATTWQNKVDYAQRHGYALFDESNLVDTRRPPAWSKPLAVRRLFAEEDCDWVVWMDADTVIMNANIPFQSVLPTPDSDYDLVITGDLKEDRKNNGVWMLRKSSWSLDFLHEWYYNMTSYIAPVGEAYSGDQHAMNVLIRKFPHKVLSPPQCTFNSFVHLIERDFDVNNMTQQEWYKSEYYYHQGDFIAHAAGCDLKLKVLKEFVKLAN